MTQFKVRERGSSNRIMIISIERLQCMRRNKQQRMDSILTYLSVIPVIPGIDSSPLCSSPTQAKSGKDQSEAPVGVRERVCEGVSLRGLTYTIMD